MTPDAHQFILFCYRLPALTKSIVEPLLIEKLSISLDEYYILSELSWDEYRTQADLCQVLCLRRSYISSHVRNLRRKDCIWQEKHFRDDRMRLLHLTSKGKLIVSQAATVVSYRILPLINKEEYTAMLGFENMLQAHSPILPGPD